MDSLYAIKKSIKNYASGGNVLIVATLLAFIIANSPIADMYFSWWAQPISLQLGDFNLFSHNGHPMTVMEFINDALMAIFFFFYRTGNKERGVGWRIDVHKASIITDRCCYWWNGYSCLIIYVYW